MQHLAIYYWYFFKKPRHNCFIGCRRFSCGTWEDEKDQLQYAYITDNFNRITYFPDLNFGRLATGFGLLKLPKMPELKGKNISDFEELEIDFNSIPYM